MARYSEHVKVSLDSPGLPIHRSAPSGAPSTSAQTREWTLFENVDQVDLSGLDSDQVQTVELNSKGDLAQQIVDGLNRYPGNKWLVYGQGQDAAHWGEVLDRVEQASGRRPDLLMMKDFPAARYDQAQHLGQRAEVVLGSPTSSTDAAPMTEALQALQRTPGMSGESIARKAVAKAAIRASESGLTAFKGTRLEDSVPAMRLLVKRILQDKVDPKNLYTNLLKADSYSVTEPRSQEMSQRDLVGFLEHLSQDQKVTSERVRQAAAQAARALNDSVLSTHQGKAGGQGVSGYLPWKNPQPVPADYAQQSGWNQLLEYIYDTPTTAPATAQAPNSEAGLTQKAAKAVLYGYKKYVSPYDGGRCDYSPSCSQYAREAVEEHGVVDGFKMGFMRLVSCNGHGPGGDDPVPGGHAHHHTHSHSPLPDLRVAPPPRQEKGALRRGLESAFFTTAKITGAVLGGAAGVLTGLVGGAALGARLGYVAGSGQTQEFETQLRENYGEHKQESFSKLVKPLTATGRFLADKVGGNLVTGVLGAGVGLVLGALGAAYQTGKWFGEMGAGGFEHAAMDSCGELPPHYLTEQILARDYA